MKDIINYRLNQANDRLKAGNLKVSINLRGAFLSLQATLPPKPNSGKNKPYQQRLSLGIPATVEGISRAEKEARKLRTQLDAGEFVWSLPPAPAPEKLTVQDWTRKLEVDYFSRRAVTPQTMTTWRGDYLKSFNKIKANELTPQAIREAVLSTEPDSRNRRRVVMALTALAKFAGIDANIANLAGSYSPQKVQPRDLPSDETIAQWYERIPDPAWRWFYGVLAAYGLRPHEAFHIESFDGVILEVGEETKTGSRLVWPLYPEWFEAWNLAEINTPKVSTQTNSVLGHRAGKYFKRLGLQFPLYNLRHCWARRSIEFGLESPLAAQQMGHSLLVHSSTYHAWLGKKVHARAFNLMIEKEGRPRPPALKDGS